MDIPDQPTSTDQKPPIDLGQQLSIHYDAGLGQRFIAVGGLIFTAVLGFTAYYLWEWKPLSRQIAIFLFVGVAAFLGGIVLFVGAGRRRIPAEKKERRTNGVVLMLFSLIFIALGFNFGLGSGLLALMMMTLAASLLLRGREASGRFTAVHENGLRSTLDKAEEAILWSEVETIKQFDYSTLLVRQDQSSVTLMNHPVVMRSVHQNVVSPLTEETARRIKAGEHIAFGPITADEQGLTVGTRHAAWEQIDSLSMDIAYVYINERGKPRGGWKVAVNNIENLHVLLNLSRKLKEGVAFDQQLQLAGPEVYRANSSRLLGGVLLCLLGAGGIFYAEANTLINYSEGVEPFLWWFLGIPLLLAGLWRIYLLAGTLGSEVTLSSQAITFRRGGQRIDIAWSELDEVRYQHFMIQYGNLPLFAWYMLSIEADDGRQIRIRRGYQRYEVMHSRINAAFVEHQLPNLQQALERGEGIHFGVVALDQTGLTIDGEAMAWEMLAGVKMRGLRLTFVKSDGFTVWKRLPLRKIPNYPLFLALAENYVIYENPTISV